MLSLGFHLMGIFSNPSGKVHVNTRFYLDNTIINENKYPTEYKFKTNNILILLHFYKGIQLRLTAPWTYITIHLIRKFVMSKLKVVRFYQYTFVVCNNNGANQYFDNFKSMNFCIHNPQTVSQQLTFCTNGRKDIMSPQVFHQAFQLQLLESRVTD